MRFSASLAAKALAAAAFAAAVAVPASQALAGPAAPQLVRPAADPTDRDCPFGSFCTGNNGLYHHSDGNKAVSDISPHLNGPASWGWNRTGGTWCIYSQPNFTGQKANVPNMDSGTTGFNYRSARPGAC